MAFEVVPSLANHDAQNVDEYDYQALYIVDEGLTQLPVSSGHAPIVRTHARRGQKIVTWECVGVRDLTKLPNPESVDSNEVFIGGHITSLMPLETADGRSMLYKMSGVWRYALKVVPSDIRNGMVKTGRGPHHHPSVNKTVRREDFYDLNK